MRLVIDAGNTNVVFALYDGAEQRAVHRLETQDIQSISAIQLPFDLVEIDGVVIASVVPRLNDVLTRFCVEMIHCDPFFVTYETIPLEIKLDDPAQGGADRLVNAYMAGCEYGTPVVIVDFGTATTFDVVDVTGAFVGGVIAPGVNLSQEALSGAAAQLPEVTVAKPAHVIGKNTIEAMQAGLYWGYVGLVEGCLQRIENELGQKPYIIATGGLADLFSDAIPAIKTVDKDLTLRGLMTLNNEVTNK